MSHIPRSSSSELFGLMAEFDSAQHLLDAAVEVHAAGFTRTDAYSPFPIHGLAEAIGFRERLIPKLVLAAGLIGAFGAFGFEYWAQAIAYPMNIGGRPQYSWVSFIPPAYEITILFAAFTAGLSMIFLNGLPRPYHPVFNAPNFHRASQDRFFLSIEARDPKFQVEDTRAFLARLGAHEVVAVEG